MRWVARDRSAPGRPSARRGQRLKELWRRLSRRLSQLTAARRGTSSGTTGGSEVWRAASRYLVRISLSDLRSSALCSRSSTASLQAPGDDLRGAEMLEAAGAAFAFVDLGVEVFGVLPPALGLVRAALHPRGHAGQLQGMRLTTDVSSSRRAGNCRPELVERALGVLLIQVHDREVDVDRHLGRKVRTRSAQPGVVQAIACVQHCLIAIVPGRRLLRPGQMQQGPLHLTASRQRGRRTAVGRDVVRDAQPGARRPPGHPSSGTPLPRGPQRAPQGHDARIRPRQRSGTHSTPAVRRARTAVRTRPPVRRRSGRSRRPCRLAASPSAEVRAAGIRSVRTTRPRPCRPRPSRARPSTAPPLRRPRGAQGRRPEPHRPAAGGGTLAAPSAVL